MSDPSKVPPVHAQSGQEVGAQQQVPLVITELRTFTRTLLDGGILITPLVELRGTAEPGAFVSIEDTASFPSSTQAGDDGTWVSSGLSLERGPHVFTAIVRKPDGDLQSPPFSIEVAIGERFRISGFYLPHIGGGLRPCGGMVPIPSPQQYPHYLMINGQQGTRVQVANSQQSAETPAPDSPLWTEEVTIVNGEAAFEAHPIGLLPIGNWFHVRAVDGTTSVVAKCLANFVPE